MLPLMVQEGLEAEDDVWAVAGVVAVASNPQAVQRPNLFSLASLSAVTNLS